MLNQLFSAFMGGNAGGAGSASSAAGAEGAAGGAGGDAGNPMGMLGQMFNMLKPMLMPLMLIVGIGLLVSGKLGSVFGGLMDMIGVGGGNNEAESPSASTSAQTVSDTKGSSTQVDSKAPETGPRQSRDAQITNHDDKPNTAVLNDKGELIAGNNPKGRVDPASTTKAAALLTAADMIKSGELPQDFFAQVEKHSPGLVDRMMKNSNNDAADQFGQLAAATAGKDTLATSGGRPFNEHMNEMLSKRGMGETSNFVTVNGMHTPEHYSTAEDMAKISHTLAIVYPEVTREYMFAKDVVTSDRDGDGVGDYHGVGGTWMGKTGTLKGDHGRITTATALPNPKETGKAWTGAVGNGAAYAVAEAYKSEIVGTVEATAKLAGQLGDFDVKNLSDGATVAANSTASVAAETNASLGVAG